MLRESVSPGKRPQRTAAAWIDLDAVLATVQTATLTNVQASLADHHGKISRSRNGV